MNTTTEKLTQAQTSELQRLDRAILKAQAELAQILARKIEYHRAEIAQAEAELETLDLRIFANNTHVFTLVFRAGLIALVEVYGAPSEGHARDKVAHAFKCSTYTVVSGDQSNGREDGTFRCWYGRAAQERQPHHDHIRTIIQEDHA